MKKELTKIGGGVLILLLSANLAFAGGRSYSIPVSCTIPEIPGLNAPLKENSPINSQMRGEETYNYAAKKETLLIDQEMLGEKTIRQTFYAR